MKQLYDTCWKYAMYFLHNETKNLKKKKPKYLFIYKIWAEMNYEI